MQMLELKNRLEDPWPETWRPVGEGDHIKESFGDWWARNKGELGHIHPEIASQWIYRHWKGSRLTFLDVRNLTWRIGSFSTESFLNEVKLEWGGPAEPEHDYDIFRPDRPTGALSTAENWADGSWTIAPVLLATPDGIASYDGDMPEIRYLIVEGSKRYRWLNALHHRAEKTGNHKAYILEQGA